MVRLVTTGRIASGAGPRHCLSMCYTEEDADGLVSAVLTAHRKPCQRIQTRAVVFTLARCLVTARRIALGASPRQRHPRLTPKRLLPVSRQQCSTVHQ